MCDKNNVILERFQELIRDSGKTRQVIAQEIGCDTSTVTKQFNGDMKISVDYLVKYARYFHVSTDYLLGMEKDELSDHEKLCIVRDYTGLSKESVKQIRMDLVQSDNVVLRPYFNYLVESGLFNDLSYYLNQYAFRYMMTNELPVDDQTKRANKEKEILCLYYAQEQIKEGFIKFCRRYEDGENNVNH